MNTHAVATVRESGDIIESVLIKGDLGKLTPSERSQYYMEVCRSVGLNPMTKPFEYITLNGKLTLYALRNCTDQLRTIHKVSVVDLTETEREGVFIVTAKVQNGDGRTDMAKGAVTIGNLKGDALANALMKAETKAKRRATLSICGLGFLDETEIETIPGASRRPPPAAEIALAAEANDPETGEVGPRVVDVTENGGAKNWIAFGSAIIAGVRSTDSADEAAQWTALNQASIDAMKREAPKAHTRLLAAVAEHVGSLPVDAKVEDAPKLLPLTESAALREGLIKQIHRCSTTDALNEWSATRQPSLDTLQPDDKQFVNDEWSARQSELYEREQTQG